MYVHLKWAKSEVRVIECHNMSNLDQSISMCVFLKLVTDVGYLHNPMKVSSKE